MKLLRFTPLVFLLSYVTLNAQLKVVSVPSGSVAIGQNYVNTNGSGNGYKLEVTGEKMTSLRLNNNFSNPGAWSSVSFNQNGDTKNWIVVHGGITSPHNFFVTGWGGVYASQFHAVLSDSRYKTNITPVDDFDKIIDNINGYYYDLKSNHNGYTFENKLTTGLNNIGFLAQDVQKVLPLAVSAPGDTSRLALQYEAILPPLVEYVKNLKSRIIELEKETITVSNPPYSNTKRRYKNLDFSILPNPNNGSFTIQIANKTEGSYRCVITDFSGKLIKSFDINSNKEELNFENDVKGVYFIHLTLNGVVTVTKKFLLN